MTWSSGLKTLEDAKAVNRVEKIRSDRLAATERQREASATATVHREQSPFRQKKLLETETVPVSEWVAGHKVVPPGRRQKIVPHNQGAKGLRSSSAPRTPVDPTDETWNTESFKTLDPPPRRVRPCTDEWESGVKVVPEAALLARDRHFHKVPHPYTWYDESLKTLPSEESRNIDIFYHNNREDFLKWDYPHSHLLNEPVLPREKRNFALNHDWYMAGKVLPHEDQYEGRHQIIVEGTGWDSGLRNLPPKEKLPRRMLRPRFSREYWDIENRKTLDWEHVHTPAYSESNRHIRKPRHEDLMKFHDRICRPEGKYSWV